MADERCENCEFFIQHYAISGGQIFRVHYGHCVQRRSKGKRPDCTACPDFAPGVPDEDAFVRKDYLTKELLQYLLNMELLPLIKDAAEMK